MSLPTEILIGIFVTIILQNVIKAAPVYVTTTAAAAPKGVQEVAYKDLVDLFKSSDSPPVTEATTTAPPSEINLDLFSAFAFEKMKNDGLKVRKNVRLNTSVMRDDPNAGYSDSSRRSPSIRKKYRKNTKKWWRAKIKRKLHKLMIHNKLRNYKYKQFLRWVQTKL